MHIHFVRSGGFAGMKLETSLDTASLPPDEAQALRNEVEQARFFELPTDIRSVSGGADRFHYQITVDNGETMHTVEVGEAGLPETLQPLVQHLDQLARTRR